MKENRRAFIKKTALSTAGLSLGISSMSFGAKSYNSIIGSNDRINMGVLGVKGKGFDHLRQWARMSGSANVYVKTICEVDENLWAERVAEVTKIQNKKPSTEYDMRRVFDDKDIDAVSMATPNHWHALGTIWALQAGKHVYVEKPCSHNAFEGRKMVDAARKYKKIVQAGFQNHSNENVRKAIQFMHNGGIGDVYMAKALCYKPRDSFGTSPDAEVPSGLHFDLWLGPASQRPYNEKKGHYNWHWHWATGGGDIANQGVHQIDIARWALNKKVHPIKVSSSGGYYKFTKEECSQETPNTQSAVLEYSDGKILQAEVRGLYTKGEGPDQVKIGNLFYGTEGWLQLEQDTWKTYMGRSEEPGVNSETVGNPEGYIPAKGEDGHFTNFIQAMRSGKMADQTCDIEEGHYSTVLPLLANISYRLGRSLVFDPKTEKFVNDAQADTMLTREYRKPYVVEDQV